MTNARAIAFETVDVFTTTRFGGNQLAVFFPEPGALSAAQMQAIAAEMNLSETTFVLPPEQPGHTARVRIFNRTSEMPFAGHPNVGTAFVLARRRPELGDILHFEEPAGLVEVRLKREGRDVVGAEIDAPQRLQTLGTIDPARIASCVGLASDQIDTSIHVPTRATVGVEFVLAEVCPGALAVATPDLAGFRRALAEEGGLDGRLSVLLYERHGDAVRARMFAPLAGTWEDPATGSANATLAALRLSLSEDDRIAFSSTQGVEMGRPSRLDVAAVRRDDGIWASVGGTCVPVLSGALQID